MIDKLWIVFLTFFLPVCLSIASFSAVAETIAVSASGDSGLNTFRDAINKANKDKLVDSIKFQPGLDPIELRTPVIYTGTQTLMIDGGGATVSQKGSENLLIANGGGDLHFFNISFIKALKTGIIVNVPAGNLPREQTVSLNNVILRDNGWYGLHFDDQNGGDGKGSDSSSSLRLLVIDSTITNNNNPALSPSSSDKDGIRVDEGGIGDVTTIIVRSALDKNAAEGIEIDETGMGDVFVTVSKSSFDNNGAQPQKLSDLEDGLDVDEAGPGSIRATITESTISANRDEGLDLDEADDGEVYLALINVDTSENADENVKVTQLGNGNVTALFRGVIAKNSKDGDGIKLESFDNGESENPVGGVFATIEKSIFAFNDSDDIQIEAARGELVVSGSNIGAKKLSENIVLTTVP